MKKIVIICCMIFIGLLLYGQGTNVTNNNTIIIQGNVYYFQPSNSTSSALPIVGRNNFIGTGSWYGESAAKAWASISDWAVERCISSSGAIIPGNNEKVYISQVHSYLPGSPEAKRYSTTGFATSNGYSLQYNSSGSIRIGGIAIYYWIVRNGERMEDGHRAYRYFVF